MPRESNYFEEAYRLCQDANPLVSATCKSLYKIMALSRVNNTLLPLGNFNILYFFQSTIRVLLKQFPGDALAPSVFPCDVDPINGCNWPDESQAQKLTIQEESSLITHYMEMVSEDSTPCGDNVDVT
jgi:hypothetical protein